MLEVPRIAGNAGNTITAGGAIKERNDTAIRDASIVSIHDFGTRIRVVSCIRDPTSDLLWFDLNIIAPKDRSSATTCCPYYPYYGAISTTAAKRSLSYPRLALGWYLVKNSITNHVFSSILLLQMRCTNAFNERRTKE